MPDVTVEVEIYCSCGEGLCGQSETSSTRYGRDPAITVEPCGKCLEAAREEGHSAGYSECETDNDL